MKKQTFESEFLLSDEEILKLGVPNKDIETYRRKHYQDSFSIGSWYEKLNDHTFKTLSVPLYVKEAHALIELYRIKLLKNSTLSETSQEHLETLTKRLDEVLSKFQHGAFVKLNTRSPKDVPHSDYENPKYRKILDEELKKFKDLTPNNVIRAYFIAMNKSMRVTNGKEAVELLSKSYRVNEDLGKNTSYGDELYASGLEVREWIPGKN